MQMVLIALAEVPNAPCGVESCCGFVGDTYGKEVPNAPCGVESSSHSTHGTINSTVPNAPCGVERHNVRKPTKAKRQFLMHRVELKGTM